MHETFFEISRRSLKSAPFIDERNQNNFNIPLKQWGSFCESTRQERRSFYRVSNFIGIEHISTQAAFEYPFFSENSTKTIKVFLVKESVVNFEVDAVINAANETLLGGGGVDGAIHNGAGPTLLKECAFLEGCKTGEAVITKGYDLPAKYVLHTVGPRCHSGETHDQAALKRCYEACFKLCDDYHLKTVAAPCVGCGVYGFPLSTSARLVKEVIQAYLDGGNPTIEVVILALFQEEEWSSYFSVFNSSR
jgi:O-acetyl-ADP-ribose deacetylase (regulator of RNase III)